MLSKKELDQLRVIVKAANDEASHIGAWFNTYEIADGITLDGCSAMIAAINPQLLLRVIDMALSAKENQKHTESAIVPDGYAIVPIKPTPKMVDATFNHAQEYSQSAESHNARNRRVWAAMVDIAQETSHVQA